MLKNATLRPPQAALTAAHRPCHAAQARSGVRRARPDVNIRHPSHLRKVYSVREEREMHAYPGNRAAATTDAAGPSPRHAARPVVRACSSMCRARADVGKSQTCTHAASALVRKCVWGAGRPGGVGGGDFLRSAFLSPASRTWCSRVRRKLSDLEMSLFGRDTAL